MDNIFKMNLPKWTRTSNNVYLISGWTEQRKSSMCPNPPTGLINSPLWIMGPLGLIISPGDSPRLHFSPSYRNMVNIFPHIPTSERLLKFIRNLCCVNTFLLWADFSEWEITSWYSLMLIYVYIRIYYMRGIWVEFNNMNE